MTNDEVNVSRLGRRTHKNVAKLTKIMRQAGAIAPSGTPLTSRQIKNLPGQPFRTHSLTNHLAKKPQFEQAGTIRIPNLDGTGTYPVSTWWVKNSAEPADQPSTADISSDTET